MSKFKGFDYIKLSNYQEITDYLLDTDCQVHELGLSSNDDMIYGLSVGDLTKPMIFIDGTMHGAHEWRCTHWVKEFIERIDKPLLDDNKAIIDELKTKFCFMAIPCLNTYGYLNNSYNNANGVNLNRNFSVGWDNYKVNGYDVPGNSNYKGTAPMSEPESQIIQNIYDTYRVIGHVNCHTWGGAYGGIFETGSTNIPQRTFLNAVMEELKVTLPVVAGGLVIRYKSTPSIPWVNEWGASQSSKSGRNTISVIFETGSEETDYMKAEIGMTGLFIFSKRMLKLYETTIQI